MNGIESGQQYPSTDKIDHGVILRTTVTPEGALYTVWGLGEPRRDYTSKVRAEARFYALVRAEAAWRHEHGAMPSDAEAGMLAIIDARLFSQSPADVRNACARMGWTERRNGLVELTADGVSALARYRANLDVA